MSNIIPTDEKNKMILDNTQNDLISISEDILFDAKSDITTMNTISLPIAEMATLGTGVSSLIPALRTITETTAVNTNGLYQLANEVVGDSLKKAKNGNYWGAFKTVEGKSKFAQLKLADPLSQTTTTVMPIDPATMMMAVALSSIEHQLGTIIEMEKQIISFLENEKQASIEADVETLISIISKYKYNWDNEEFVHSNHKMVNDIERTARSNMIFYQKELRSALEHKALIVGNAKVKSVLNDMQKKYKYYRLSLYTFSLASLLEIMLSGNFKEEYILEIKNEIEKLSHIYRDLFYECSIYLEKLCKSSLEINLLKGVGNASKLAGNVVGNIPLIKKGSVDELLLENGDKINSSATGIENDAIRKFAELSNPGTLIFIDQIKEMNLIYNHTSKICFDKERVYLVNDMVC